MGARGRGIEAVGLAKRFGAVRALDGVDLEVPAGRITALVGRNGAGKSTLMRILATAILPDEGSVRVEGIDVVEDPQGVRRRIGLVLGEERSFFWRLSGRQNLEFFAALHGLSRRAAREASTRALAAVGLTDTASRRVDRYSTGMRCRLGIARALLGSPSVLLLDEPTRSLDPAAACDLRLLVGSLVVDRGATVLLATHDLREASSMTTETLVLERGRVVARCGVGVEVAELEAAVVGGVR